MRPEPTLPFHRIIMTDSTWRSLYGWVLEASSAGRLGSLALPASGVRSTNSEDMK